MEKAYETVRRIEKYLEYNVRYEVNLNLKDLQMKI